MPNRLLAEGLILGKEVESKSAGGKEKLIGIAVNPDRIDDVVKRIRANKGFDDDHPHPPWWFRGAGVGFAALTIGFLMFMLLGQRPIQPDQKIIFDVLMAFSASASGTFLGGDAIASGEIPFFKKSPIRFSAVGGIGIFVVVFLILRYSA